MRFLFCCNLEMKIKIHKPPPRKLSLNKINKPTIGLKLQQPQQQTINNRHIVVSLGLLTIKNNNNNNSTFCPPTQLFSLSLSFIYLNKNLQLLIHLLFFFLLPSFSLEVEASQLVLSLFLL